MKVSAACSESSGAMGFSLSASAAASSASGSAVPPSAVGWSSQKVAKTLASRLGKKTNEFETTSSGVAALSQGSLLGSSKPMYQGQLCAGPRRGTLIARPDTCSPWGLEERGGAQQMWDLLGQRESQEAGADVGTQPDTAVTRPDTSEDVSSLRGGCSATQRRWALTSSSSLSS